KTAAEFCKWLSARSGRAYRLPTEAEWEWAARAGATGDFAFDESKASDYAWYEADSDAKPHPVATKKPSAWGLYDMEGNVAEWVTGADGQPVTKGGSYRDGVEALKISSRSPKMPGWNASDPQMPKSQWWLSDGPFVGFRVVCDSAPGDPKDTPADK